jgi:acyl homoserine lactone synthase
MPDNDAPAHTIQVACAKSGTLEVSVLRIPEGLDRWNLVADFLRLRKEVFINRLAWPLYARDGLEFEQYDTVHAVYVVAHCGDAVFGGARLLPTIHRVGQGKYTYSYMIRDACRNILPGLPQDLCDQPPPVEAQTWELTRLATLGDTRVGGEVLLAANQFLRSIGASRCLFLASPTFMRMAKRLGFTPEALGGVKANAEGSFLAFSCHVI